MAIIYDMNINAAANFNLGMQVAPGGVPMDLTGYKVYMQVRPVVGSPAVEASYNTDNGKIVWVNQVLGQFNISLLPADTAALAGGVYDVVMVSAAGYATRLAQGFANVNPAVTILS